MGQGSGQIQKLSERRRRRRRRRRQLVSPGGYRPPDPPPWISDLIDSVLKLILYGSRIRINQSYPGNIGNLNFLISHILEILEISIFIFPHNIENLF